MASGRVVGISGGANGIGKATARKFLSLGARKVYIGDVDKTGGEQAEEELNKDFGNNSCKFLCCDVTNCTQYEDFFKKIICESKTINVFFNNAGVNENAPNVLDVNLLGCLRGITFAHHYMAFANGGQGGAIINNAALGAIGTGDYSAHRPKFTASKYAIIGLTKSYSSHFYFNRIGVKMMAICPGFTDTEFVADSNKPDAVIQNPDIVAECVYEIVLQNENGSIWCVNQGRMFQVDYPHYRTLVRKTQPHKIIKEPWKFFKEPTKPS